MTTAFLFRRVFRFSGFLLGAFAATFVGGAGEFSSPSQQAAPAVETHFGQTVLDPERWLEVSTSPSVAQWVRTQSENARRYLDKLPDRKILLTELKRLNLLPSAQDPFYVAGRLFYVKNDPRRQKKILCWDEKGLCHVAFDPNNLPVHETMGDWWPSPDGQRLAYVLLEDNTSIGRLHLRDLKRGLDERETILWRDFADFSWEPDSAGFYYTKVPSSGDFPENRLPAEAVVARHRIGNDPGADQTIFPKTGDSSVYLTPQVSADGKWLFVLISRGWASSSIYARSVSATTNGFFPLFVSTNARAQVDAANGYFYLLTNRAAPEGSLLRSKIEDFSTPHWIPIIPDRPAVRLESFKLTGQHLLVKTCAKATNQLEIYSQDGRLERPAQLPQLGTILNLAADPNEDTAFVDYESFFFPPRILQVSLETGVCAAQGPEMNQSEKTPFSVRQLVFPSKDGTPVSLFLLSKGAPHNRPLLLEGYGGFDVPILPYYDAELTPFLEAGGAVAVVNLRGGGEYGETWHQAGMLTRKQNTFDDFEAAASFLVAKGFADPQRLATQGSSNAGLLVAAVVTQVPELFKAVVCRNPLTDMVRYTAFGEGLSWVPEYGSPDKRDEFAALYAYSPYHHVRAATYPAMLFVSSAEDDRVTPIHARKMVAELQRASTSRNPILLLTVEQAGHAGTGLSGSQIEETADRLAFLMDQLGLRPSRH